LRFRPAATRGGAGDGRWNVDARET
jgi:hypothetical protein